MQEIVCVSTERNWSGRWSGSWSVSWSALITLMRTWDYFREPVFLHLWEQPLGPIGPSGQRSHLSPVTPAVQLQRPLLSHEALTEPGGTCPTLVLKLICSSPPEHWECLKERYLLWFLTCGVAAAGFAAQSRPLQVEAVLAALAVAALSVSLTVDTVQAPGVPKTVPWPPIAVATHGRCSRRQWINFI